ncbi:MAG: hypothetical protein H0T79_06700 [Deltaproteobacteria bacterium]|nr:hypothetical protein [Deltaproteobacteria bacterium]
MARHPILLVSWAILGGFGLLAFVCAPALMMVPILGSPILAIATLAAAGRYPHETLARAWRIPYHAALGGLVISGLIGIVTSAAKLASDRHGWHFENAPLGLLFLLAVLIGWRAIITPSPPRAALPGMILHVSWIPLVIVNLFTLRHDRFVAMPVEGMFWSAVAILGFSLVAGVIAILGFEAPPTVAVPVARVA